MAGFVGAEALLRWNHPSRGQLTPAQFIGLAEETGIIVTIGEWVLREACAEARRWQEDLGWPGWISVNLSARQVAQSGLGSTVSDVLTRTGLDPHVLWLELTETALLRTGNSAAGELVAIEGLGAHLGMDDFGTGYASLSNLQRLPIDFLKIDSDFVTKLGRNASSPENGIVAAITQLGQTLNLQIIAEGIETVLQLEMLRAYGCTTGQGFLLARPVTALEITTLLAASPRAACQPSACPDTGGGQARLTCVSSHRYFARRSGGEARTHLAPYLAALIRSGRLRCPHLREDHGTPIGIGQHEEATPRRISASARAR